MKCLVIDSDKKERSDLVSKLKDMEQFTSLKSFRSFSEAVGEIQANGVEVIFFDVNCLRNGEGSFLSKHARHRPHFVITGDKKEDALEAFNVEAVDFILKPVSKIRLTKTLSRLNKVDTLKTNISERSKELFIKLDGNYIKLSLADIILIESTSTKVNVHTTFNKYILNASLKSMLAKLPSNEFAMVHKSFIVRLDKIASIEEDILTVERHRIPLSDKYKQELMSKLKII